ncbi:MAG: DUF362 domain-containing protein [bacterium]
MKHKVVIKKIDPPGGSPLKWDARALDKLKETLGELIEQSGFNLNKIKNASVLLHPNLVRPHLSRPASFTDPRLILAAAALFKESGAGSVGVGENPGLKYPARQAFKESGLTDSLAKMDVNAHYFDEGKWKQVSNPQGRLFRTITVSQDVLDTDFFVNIPKMKTHMLTEVSLCLKNLLGIIHDNDRMLLHRNDIADKVVDLNFVRSPDLNIVDGLWAMEGQAPFHGMSIEEFNVLVIGKKAPVVDAVCCRVMGYIPDEVPHVKLALKRLVKDWNGEDQVELCGDSIGSIKREFKRPILSSLGSFDPIECIECGVCNGCLSAVRHSLDWLQAEIDMSGLPKCTIVSGRPMPNRQTLESWNGKLLLFGNCAAEFQFYDLEKRVNAIWIPGCPPHVLDLAMFLKTLNKK